MRVGVSPTVGPLLSRLCRFPGIWWLRGSLTLKMPLSASERQSGGFQVWCYAPVMTTQIWVQSPTSPLSLTGKSPIPVNECNGDFSPTIRSSANLERGRLVQGRWNGIRIVPLCASSPVVDVNIVNYSCVLPSQGNTVRIL
jgi:hypothetical protein